MRRVPAIGWCLGLGGGALAVSALVGACDGMDSSVRLTEPIVVHGAQFILGELPGTPPATRRRRRCPASHGPSVTAIQVLNTTIYSGEAGSSSLGDVDQAASAVAIRLGELGTGYWVLPLGSADPEVPGQLTFSALVDFNVTLAAGVQPLRVVGVTSGGQYGVQSDQNLCLASRLPSDPGSSFPSDITACVPTLNPPEAIFALTWDADVDLDLHVITPAGVDVNAKEPLVDPIDAGQTPSMLDPRIDRDSIALCVPDGWREEDLVFPTRPSSGSVFQIYANLFSACSFPAVTFTLTVYEPTGTANVDRHLVQTFKQSGTLNAIDADGDSSGVFIVSYPF